MAQLGNGIIGLESAMQSAKAQIKEQCHNKLVDYANYMCSVYNEQCKQIIYEINVTVANPEVGNVFYDPKHADQFESKLIPNLTDAMHFVVVQGDDMLSVSIVCEFYNQNMTITDKVKYTISQIAEMTIQNGNLFTGNNQ